MEGRGLRGESIPFARCLVALADLLQANGQLCLVFLARAGRARQHGAAMRACRGRRYRRFRWRDRDARRAGQVEPSTRSLDSLYSIFKHPCWYRPVCS